MSLPDFLGKLPYFSGLDPDELQRLCEAAERISLPAGELLLEEGSPSEAMYVVLEGRFEVTRRSGDRHVVLGTVTAGEVLGEMSLLDDTARSASAQALVDSQVAEISRSAFQQLLDNPTSVLAMLRTVTFRLRSSEAALRQSEKMAALGTMTAGLMHELNNPAAAVRRSAAHLLDLLQDWRRVTARLGGAEVEALLSAPQSAGSPIGALERSEREDEMASWLEKRGVEDAWELAPSLVAQGWDIPALEERMHGLPDEQAAPLLTWLGLGHSIDELVEELSIGAQRISEIVAAVKSYSYQGQGEVQDVDLQRGLEDTLVMLRHKLSGVEVVRDYAAGLPHIEGSGSDLNQVWTNLIDNAADALEGKGRLVVRTRREDNQVAVEVTDDGPGIPPEVQDRIFELFFTTKPPGKGTGQGLPTSYGIVTRHGGEIQVSSRPGETTFRVVLPLGSSSQETARA
ncbi:MAG: cyclic nucleotide-binding domain-containing protein [Actinomycetota bacterium]|nr:cyclic nucleotide-binding domain-containing protein [Actinomycetota bacterium]